MDTTRSGSFSEQDTEEQPVAGTASARYGELAGDKLVYLERSRECARVTIPWYFPPQGHSSSTKYPTPWQSVGADGVNNLCAKLQLALFPPGEPFFKLTLTGKTLAMIEKQGKQANAQGSTEDVRAHFEDALSHVEKAVIEELEGRGARISQTDALRQLIISGNALIEVRPDNRLKTHRLENYVVRRDVDGDAVEIITRQTLKRQSLPKEARAFLKKLEAKSKMPGDTITNASDQSQGDRSTSFDGNAIDLYTIAWIDDEKSKPCWCFQQEMMGHVIPGTDGTWPLDTPAFIPLTWSRIQGEHYGRGMVEEYLGDFNSLESITQAMVEFADVSSKILFGVDETGITRTEDIMNAPSGHAIIAKVKNGKFEDVAVLQVDKQADFSITMQVSNEIKTRLERAFMRTQTRDAERVTAEEIRILAKELEDTLGGVYSVMAQEWQRPLVRRVMLNMQKMKSIDPFPKGMVRPQILAGLEGLGREAELQKLDTLLTGVAQFFGPPAVAQNMNIGNYILRRAAALGIESGGLVKSDEQLQQEAQAAQQAQTQQQLGPHIIKAASDQAKSMREHPGSPVDQNPQAPGGTPGAQTPPTPAGK